MKYKINILSVLEVFIWLNIGCMVFSLIVWEKMSTILLFFYVLNASVLIAYLLHKNLLLIEFDQEVIKVKCFRLFIVNTKSYNYKDLTFSNDLEMVGRNNPENVLKLFFKGQKIFAVYPSLSGFDSRETSGIMEAMALKGVPKTSRHNRVVKN